MWSKSLETLNPYEGVHEVAPDDLLPCPFCGGEAEAETHFSCVYERIYGEVKCKKCGTIKRGPKTFDTYDATYEGYDTPEWVQNAHKEARKSAIEKWNRRADNG